MKSLEALDRIKNALFNRNEATQIINDIDFATIEKELKVLEILKKHEMVRYIEWFGLTKEEIELLKEVL